MFGRKRYFKHKSRQSLNADTGIVVVQKTSCYNNEFKELKTKSYFESMLTNTTKNHIHIVRVRF